MVYLLTGRENSLQLNWGPFGCTGNRSPVSVLRKKKMRTMWAIKCQSYSSFICIFQIWLRISNHERGVSQSDQLTVTLSWMTANYYDAENSLQIATRITANPRREKYHQPSRDFLCKYKLITKEVWSLQERSVASCHRENTLLLSTPWSKASIFYK